MKTFAISVLCLLSTITPLHAQTGVNPKDYKTYTKATLNIRDPFILPVKATGTYYMYRTSSVKDAGGNLIGGVEVFKSKDLKKWEGPTEVCRLPEDNWSRGYVWAPEVHEYNGKYYLFATVNSDVVWKGKRANWPDYIWRATQIFKADTPEGPFRALSQDPSTPLGQMALDGTLWVDNGKPYMVYCHEWVETEDGEICALPMKQDLSGADGQPIKLFNASAAPWTTPSGSAEDNTIHYVTDGCFLYKTKTGKLLMIWSSFINDRYAIGIAESTTGRVTGPWRQQAEPLFKEHGGHAMIFRSFDNRLCLLFHQPNSPDGAERAHIYEIEDMGNTLKLKGEMK